MREQLEQALLENPDDPAGYAVYADWLAEQGDPRGEFIHVQLALEDEQKTPAERKQFQQREKELLAAHEREWLGSLAEFLLDQTDMESQGAGERFGYEYRFRRGFLEYVRTPDLTEEFAQALGEASDVPFLRQLVVEGISYEGEPLSPLRQCRSFPNLRVFRLGLSDEGACHTNGESVVDVIACMSRIEELELQAHGVESARLFSLPMPHLRSLQVDHIHDYPCEILAGNASLSNLARISFWPHALEPGDEQAYLTLDDVRALARSPHLARLSILELRMCSMGDEGCRELVESGLLGRLKVLDLTHGEITDDGAVILAGSPQLQSLERLVLTGNAIGSAGLTALRNAFPRLEAEQQWVRGRADDLLEYTYHGDWE